MAWLTMPLGLVSLSHAQIKDRHKLGLQPKAPCNPRQCPGVSRQSELPVTCDIICNRLKLLDIHEKRILDSLIRYRSIKGIGQG